MFNLILELFNKILIFLFLSIKVFEIIEYKHPTLIISSGSFLNGILKKIVKKLAILRAKISTSGKIFSSPE